MRKVHQLLAILAVFTFGSVGESKLNGAVQIDGSSTVFPIAEAIAEEYRNLEPKVRVTIGVSGTGGGFKKFTAGETDLSNASRTIKPTEAEAATKNGIKYLEIPVAFDGITVVVHPKNDWADFLTVEELRKIWQPGSTVKLWSDIRKDFPKKEIKLYGPGTDSGTFDYFTEVINGKSHASRSDYTRSEDDNVLVTGVAGDRYAMGYFGYAYYAENRDKLKAVEIDNGKGPVAPSVETINKGTYAPLSRPVFVYVSAKSSQRPEVKSFVEFLIAKAPSIAGEVGYIPLPDSMYKKASSDFKKLAR